MNTTEFSFEEISKDIMPRLVNGYLIMAKLPNNSIINLMRKDDENGFSHPVFTTNIALVETICRKATPIEGIVIARQQFIGFHHIAEDLYTINTGEIFTTDNVTEEKINQSLFYWGISDENIREYSQNQFLDDVTSQVRAIQRENEMNSQCRSIKIRSSVRATLGNQYQARTGLLIGILDDNHMELLKVEKRISDPSRRVVVHFPIGKSFQVKELAPFKCELFKEEEIIN